jgi:hypothetical protein
MTHPVATDPDLAPPAMTDIEIDAARGRRLRLALLFERLQDLRWRDDMTAEDVLRLGGLWADGTASAVEVVHVVEAIALEQGLRRQGHFAEVVYDERHDRRYVVTEAA